MKPSNKDLLAERHRIREILDERHPATKGMPNADRIVAILNEQAVAEFERETTAALPEKVTFAGPVEGLPVDLAHYPRPGETPQVPAYIPGEAPPMSAMLGDLTSGYPEWYFQKHGVEATRAKYADRLHCLSAELRKLITA